MTTRILHTADLAIAADLLRQGELVAFPTETVYGLGANALNEAAVRRVYEVKGRPTDNPMIVHVHSCQQARELMQVVPDFFSELTNEFWPGPLTLIVKHNAAVPDVVTAGLDTVALRIPDLRVTRDLLRLANIPLAAPSANISGRPSPTTAEQVFNDLNGRISAVLDGGPCPLGIESTVLDLTSAEPTILRPGTVTREDLEDVTQSRVYFAETNSDRPLSPGMKYRHYAPRAELKIIPWNDLVESMLRDTCTAVRQHVEAGKRGGLIAPDSFRGCGETHWYSLGAGLAVDYARLLYAGMRELDEAGAEVILCPGIEAEGIGLAVMNRLMKAGEIQ